MTKLKKTLTIRLTDKQIFKLNQISDELGLNPSEIIRKFIENYRVKKQTRFKNQNQENWDKNVIRESESFDNKSDEDKLQSDLKSDILQNLQKLQQLRSIKIKNGTLVRPEDEN
jgi:antitoxin component of RelBE/YafQ-DinJ toxin-antitoxin module